MISFILLVPRGLRSSPWHSASHITMAGLHHQVCQVHLCAAHSRRAPATEHSGCPCLQSHDTRISLGWGRLSCWLSLAPACGVCIDSPAVHNPSPRSRSPQSQSTIPVHTPPPSAPYAAMLQEECNARLREERIRKSLRQGGGGGDAAGGMGGRCRAPRHGRAT